MFSVPVPLYKKSLNNVQYVKLIVLYNESRVNMM